MKKYFVTTLICLMLIAGVAYGTIIPGGELSGTLTAEGSPYIVMGDISVADGETLVIEPGVEIRFDGLYQFDVYGTLQAVGTEAEHILFTSNRADPQPGDWQSINFVSSEGSIVQYCRLEYGSWSETGYYYYGVINCDNSSPVISDNIIRNNERVGIVCHNISNPKISGNVINSNGWSGVKIHNFSSPIVVGNIISNNGASFSDESSGIVFNSGGTPSIVNNVIYNNAYSGIMAYAGTTSHNITNNTIYGNPEGITVFDVEEAGVTLQNCIIWGNKLGISAEPSTVQVVYSDIQGGWPGEGNIDADPLFVDPDNGDYHLSDYSPCIGAGIMTPDVPDTDIEGNPRPNPLGSNPDMGAYENPLGLPFGSISGTVTDMAGNPIKWALVIAVLGETKVKAFTDSEGYYKIPDLEPGTYWILCIKKGYKPGIRKAEVVAGGVTTVDFKLSPKPE